MGRNRPRRMGTSRMLDAIIIGLSLMLAGMLALMIWAIIDHIQVSDKGMHAPFGQERNMEYNLIVFGCLYPELRKVKQ